VRRALGGAALAGDEVELLEDRGHVALDGPLGHDHALGDRAVGVALGHQREDLTLARGQRVERTRGTPATEQAGDDLGVEHRSALGDATDRVEEPVDVGDPVRRALTAVSMEAWTPHVWVQGAAVAAVAAGCGCGASWR
jgi:hypothetical protein